MPISRSLYPASSTEGDWPRRLSYLVHPISAAEHRSDDPHVLLKYSSLGSCSIHELKYIVEDEVAPTLRHQLERLREVHWLLFFVNLPLTTMVSCGLFVYRACNVCHTINAPVTITKMLPC